MQAGYYEKLLYPLQDKVLDLLNKLETPFYLTGGTALSRAYLFHRYSDDLDFFVNADKNFMKYVEEIEAALRLTFGDKLATNTKQEAFVRLSIIEADTVLKIDFVDDVAYRVGMPIATKVFNKTDAILNILSNKVTALSREASKDMSDLLEISLHYSFNWKDVIEDAKKKDTWVDETDVLIMIEKFKIIDLQEVHWIRNIDLVEMEKLKMKVIEDIFWGKDNSLYVGTNKL